MGSQQDGIPGYDFGHVGTWPVSLDDLRQLEQCAGFEDEDEGWLRRAGDILSGQAESMVDEWRSHIGAQPELARWFFGPDGKPDEKYKAAVKSRFVQWVRDTCLRPRDRAWLDYQNEIGLRHTPAKKNRADDTRTPPLVPLRYLIGFAPVVMNVRSFLAQGSRDPDELRAMERAWGKAVLVQIALWSHAYARDSLW